MPRVTVAPARTRRRNRILRAARGYFGTSHKHYYKARNAVVRAGCYAYRDRRDFKRDMRALWITRITAACRMRGERYSRFINGLKLAGIMLNRKMLSNLAIEDPKVFDELLAKAMKTTRAQAAKAA